VSRVYSKQEVSAPSCILPWLLIKDSLAHHSPRSSTKSDFSDIRMPNVDNGETLGNGRELPSPASQGGKASPSVVNFVGTKEVLSRVVCSTSALQALILILLSVVSFPPRIDGNALSTFDI